jgi:hypothetical protein
VGYLLSPPYFPLRVARAPLGKTNGD